MSFNRRSVRHIPVLHIAEGFDGASSEESAVLRVLAPNNGETVLDVTLGLGGHSASFLKAIGRSGRLIGIDADSENLETAKQNLQAWSAQTEFHHANFRNLGSLHLPSVDIIFADLGLSSPHVDDPTRGFTFRADAPLDLRYDRTQGKTAAAWMENATEFEITDVLRKYGELREAKRIASAFYGAARHEGGLKTTGDVRSIIEKMFGFRAAALLPQVFQALRIKVNEELDALKALLSTAPNLLREGGRMAVISYHSLEDRLVKETFRTLSTPSKDPLTGAIVKESDFELLTRKSIVPSQNETTRNPRARSARMRAIRRRMASM